MNAFLHLYLGLGLYFFFKCADIEAKRKLQKVIKGDDDGDPAFVMLERLGVGASAEVNILIAVLRILVHSVH